MSASFNRVTLLGNLTRDPETRYTPSGVCVCDFALALNRKYKDPKGGEKMLEETTFVDVTLWAKLAELAGQYLKKGHAVFIEGRLQLDSWTDKASGQNRTKLIVIGENMQFLNNHKETKSHDGLPD